MVTDASDTLEAEAANPSAYRPLLADSARIPAMLVIVLAIIVTAVSGMRYAGQDMAGHVDLLLGGLIRDHLSHDQPLTQTLASLGNPASAVLLVAAVAAAAATARRWSGVLLTIVGTVTAVTVTELVLKPLIGRLRFGHLSFPSGHTTAVAAVAIATAILIGGARWPRSIRVVAGLAVVAVAAGVAISLVALDIHYATDTVAGYCVALATVPAVALFLDHLGYSLGPGAGSAQRSSRTRPPSA